MSRRKARRSFGIEPLGRVLARDTELRVPSTVETTPVAARDWEAAVGTRIAARAKPVRIDRGVLVVRAATSTWAQELSLLSEAILAQLRGRGVVVSALRFQVGPVEGPTRAPWREDVRRTPPAVPLPPAVSAVVASVADLELRAILARAAAQSLGWNAANAAANAPTSERSAARAPRSAAPGSAPQGRAPPPAREARRGKP